MITSKVEINGNGNTYYQEVDSTSIITNTRTTIVEDNTNSKEKKVIAKINSIVKHTIPKAASVRSLMNDIDEIEEILDEYYSS